MKRESDTERVGGLKLRLLIKRVRVYLGMVQIKLNPNCLLIRVNGSGPYSSLQLQNWLSGSIGSDADPDTTSDADPDTTH